MSFNDGKAAKNIKTSNNYISVPTSLYSKSNDDENYYINEYKPSILNIEKEIKLKIDINNDNSNRNTKYKSYLLYGNQINNLHPKYLGKTRAFFYINNYPIIIIGPNCKFLNVIIIFYILFFRLLYYLCSINYYYYLYFNSFIFI